MLVTSSDENRVLTLDDEPALDVYLRGLDAPPEANHDPAEFTRFALTHPLGLQRRSGEEVRFVAGADFEDRSLTCVAHVPQGGLTWFMEGRQRFGAGRHRRGLCSTPSTQLAGSCSSRTSGLRLHRPTRRAW